MIVKVICGIRRACQLRKLRKRLFQDKALRERIWIAAYQRIKTRRENFICCAIAVVLKSNFNPILKAHEVERIFPEMQEYRKEYTVGRSRQDLHDYGWFGRPSIEENRKERLKFMERVMEEKKGWNKSDGENMSSYYSQSYKEQVQK